MKQNRNNPKYNRDTARMNRNYNKFKKFPQQTKPKPKPQSKPKSNTENSEPVFTDLKTLNTYIGPKGYTILKSELSEAHVSQIKQMLMVKPFTPGINLASTVTFPAYRESTQKIYVPRFFGVAHFGPPKQMKIPDGDDIDVPFSGTLRDYQIEVVNAYVNVTQSGTSGGLVNLPCGYGKTTVALNIVSVMKKKTLIIVPVSYTHLTLPTKRIV